VQVRQLGADTLQEVEGAHPVDIQVLKVVEGPSERRSQVIDGVYAHDGPPDIVDVSQVADNGLDALIAVELVCPAGVAGKDQVADGVALLEEAFAEIRADSAGAAGDQYLHCSLRTFSFDGARRKDGGYDCWQALDGEHVEGAASIP
jgi:hypothetical protein